MTIIRPSAGEGSMAYTSMLPHEIEARSMRVVVEKGEHETIGKDPLVHASDVPALSVAEWMQREMPKEKRTG